MWIVKPQIKPQDVKVYNYRLFKMFGKCLVERF